MYIPPIFGDKPSTNPILSHAIPLPILRSFFHSNSTYNAILTTEDLLDLAPTFDLSNFNFFNYSSKILSTKYEDTKIPLDHAINRIKNDEIILSNVQQAIVLGHLDLPSPPFWLTLEGTLLIVTFIAVTLLTITVVALLIKMRTMSLALILLQKHITAVDGQTIDKPLPTPYSFKYSPNFTPITYVTSFDLSQFIDTIYKQVIITLIIAIFIILIIRYIYNKF